MGFHGEIPFSLSWTFAKAFAYNADNLHRYSSPAYQWAQLAGTTAWATLSLICLFPVAGSLNTTEEGEGEGKEAEH